MKNPGRFPDYGPLQVRALVGLRLLIGWHFLYEGVAKITNPYWTSAGYLQESQGWFSGFFQGLALNPTALTVTDYLNQWGLLLIGLALLLGVFVRSAAWAGAVLLLLYYAAAPPFPGLEYAIPMEGSYLIVNKILVEMFALLVVVGFPTSHIIGLDRIIHWKRLKENAGAASAGTGGAR
jgi:thiosulfate dehydrogenase [quinone] large subunit